MSLEGKGRHIGACNALQGPVEERDVRWSQIRWQRFRINRKTVVLAGDEYLLCIEILDRMIRAVVTEFHLERLGARRESEQLMAETDSYVGTPAASNSRMAVIA